MTLNKKKISRRRTIKSAGASSVALTLAGCLGNGTDDVQEVTLLTAETDPRTQNVFDAVAEDFEEETGNEANYEYVGFEELADRISAGVRADDPPEMVIWNVGQMAALQEDGLLMPVGDLVDDVDVEIPDDTVFEWEDSVYSIPWCRKIYHMIIRGDLLEEAGYTPPDPASEEALNVDWSTFQEWVSAIDEETDAAGTAIAASQTSKGEVDAINWLWTNAVRIFRGTTPDEEVSIDTGEDRERAIEVLEYLDDIYEYSVPGADIAWAESTDAYASGSAGSVIYSIGRIFAALEGTNPEWMDHTIPLAVPWEQHRDDGITNRQTVSQFGVFEDSENPDAAKEWLTTLYNSHHYIDLIHSVPFHNTPLTEELAQSDEYLDHELLQEYPQIAEFYANFLEMGTSAMLAGDDGGVSRRLAQSELPSHLGKLLEDTLVGGDDPGDAIDTAAENLRDI